MPYAIVVDNPMHHSAVVTGIPTEAEAKKLLPKYRKMYGHDGKYNKVTIEKRSRNPLLLRAEW